MKEEEYLEKNLADLISLELQTPSQSGNSGLSAGTSLTSYLAAKNLQLAKKSHELGYIYALFGLFDGGIIAYGNVKYFFDVFFANQSTSKMREWLSSPAGMSIAMAEVIAFVGLSLIANTNDKNSTNAFTQTAALFWPYCRSAVRELKRTAKSVSNTLKLVGLFNFDGMSQMLPLGLTFGAVSVLNRLWFQRMNNQRKDTKDQMQILTQKISSMVLLEGVGPLMDQLEQLHQCYSNIKAQSENQKKYAYFSSAYTGLTEGLAFYIGILTFISVTSPAFIPMVICCFAFAILAIATRIHEEYEYQRGVQVDALLLKLRIKEKELDVLRKLESQGNIQDVDARYKSLFTKILELNKELDKIAPVTLDKILRNLKNGLKVYAFINKMILGSTVFFTTLPAALIVSSVLVGILIMVALVIKVIIQQSNKEKELIIATPWRKDNAQYLVNALIEKLIQVHVAENAIQPSSFRAWFEVTWNFFSGLDKGRKNLSFLLMLAFAEITLHKDHESPTMIKLAIGLGVVTSLIFALRAHAQNFGDTDAVKLSDSAQSMPTTANVT